MCSAESRWRGQPASRRPLTHGWAMHHMHLSPLLVTSACRPLPPRVLPSLLLHAALLCRAARLSVSDTFVHPP